MTGAVRTMVATASVVLVLLVPPPAAHACSCTNASLAEHLQNATAVFVGRAEDSKDSPDGLVTGFRVTTVYKGPVVRRADVTTAENEAACGVPFIEGRSYAVFAQDQGGILITTLCAGTTDDLATVAGLTPIAAPASPSPRAAPDVRSTGSRTTPIVVAVLLIALVAAASALAVRASRRPRPIA